MDAMAPAELIDSQHVPLLFLNGKPLPQATGKPLAVSCPDSRTMRARFL